MGAGGPHGADEAGGAACRPEAATATAAPRTSLSMTKPQRSADGHLRVTRERLDVTSQERDQAGGRGHGVQRSAGESQRPERDSEEQVPISFALWTHKGTRAF